MNFIFTISISGERCDGLTYEGPEGADDNAAAQALRLAQSYLADGPLRAWEADRAARLTKAQGEHDAAAMVLSQVPEAFQAQCKGTVSALAIKVQAIAGETYRRPGTVKGQGTTGQGNAPKYPKGEQAGANRAARTVGSRLRASLTDDEGSALLGIMPGLGHRPSFASTAKACQAVLGAVSRTGAKLSDDEETALQDGVLMNKD